MARGPHGQEDGAKTPVAVMRESMSYAISHGRAMTASQAKAVLYLLLWSGPGTPPSPGPDPEVRPKTGWLIKCHDNLCVLCQAANRAAI